MATQPTIVTLTATPAFSPAFSPLSCEFSVGAAGAEEVVALEVSVVVTSSFEVVEEVGRFELRVVAGPSVIIEPELLLVDDIDGTVGSVCAHPGSHKIGPIFVAGR